MKCAGLFFQAPRLEAAKGLVDVLSQQNELQKVHNYYFSNYERSFKKEMVKNE